LEWCDHDDKQADMSDIPNLLPIMGEYRELSLTLTSCRLCISIVVLFDPENIGITVGLSLLSFTQAEINVFVSICGEWWHSLIRHLPLYRWVLMFAEPYYLIPKHENGR